MSSPFSSRVYVLSKSVFHFSLAVTSDLPLIHPPFLGIHSYFSLRLWTYIVSEVITLSSLMLKSPNYQDSYYESFLGKWVPHLKEPYRRLLSENQDFLFLSFLSSLGNSLFFLPFLPYLSEQRLIPGEFSPCCKTFFTFLTLILLFTFFCFLHVKVSSFSFFFSSQSPQNSHYSSDLSSLFSHISSLVRAI